MTALYCLRLALNSPVISMLLPEVSARMAKKQRMISYYTYGFSWYHAFSWYWFLVLLYGAVFVLSGLSIVDVESTLFDRRLDATVPWLHCALSLWDMTCICAPVHPHTGTLITSTLLSALGLCTAILMYAPPCFVVNVSPSRVSMHRS